MVYAYVDEKSVEMIKVLAYARIGLYTFLLIGVVWSLIIRRYKKQEITSGSIIFYLFALLTIAAHLIGLTFWLVMAN
jgi:hypothetical protein